MQPIGLFNVSIDNRKQCISFQRVFYVCLDTFENKPFNIAESKSGAKDEIDKIFEFILFEGMGLTQKSLKEFFMLTSALNDPKF